MKRLTPPCPLEVIGLGVRRGQTTILDDINWRVEHGQNWVILGANGSGKTSLLSALTGFLPPTTGQISVLGERFGRADWRQLRRRIGLVSSALRPFMADSETALETVVSGRYGMIDYWGPIRRTDRADGLRLLKKVECSALADRPWLYLSQGERQRVLIGRALMARPELLILDEPCAGLDPAAREHFLQFLERLGGGRRGPTLVLVTHHVEEIMPVFTHALVLRSGRVLASGTIRSALNSRLLSAAFGAPVRLRSARGRRSLTVSPAAKTVF